MPTFTNDGKTTTLFIFYHIISQFGVTKEIMIDYGSHFFKKMMTKLSTMLGFHQENSSPYYPEANDQVEDINHDLKEMIQRW